MNFFGHAVVAGWAHRGPNHRLGSMLPDFESMLRVSVVAIHDEGLRKGVDFHHRTDEVFHRAPTFLRLCSGALESLTALDVRRGTSRAVAHIGAEMFLDGYLAERRDDVDGYLSALSSETDGHLEWEDLGQAFSGLRARLQRWGAPRDYADPEFVLTRLGDTLSRRPALAITEEQAPRVAEFLPELQQRVEHSATELLQEIQDALGLKG